MMKKLFTLLVVVLALVLAVGCGKSNNPPKIEVEGRLTHTEYLAKSDDEAVVIAAYVQGKQIYAEAYGNTSLYLQDEEGGYFVYRWACTQEEYDKVKVGALVKVTGTKTSWSGEVEIKDAKVEVIEGKTWIADAKDVTALFGTSDLEKSQNEYVTVKGAVVVASKVKDDETEYPFLYRYNGSGDKGDDLYFNVKIGEETYTFVVESDYQTQDSEAYKAVEGLKVGDTIDLFGILYWYNGPQPHISKVVVK